MRVMITGFKSIRRISFELGKATILVGPPASGKSNILEALSTLGYVVKLVEAESGIYPSIRDIGPISSFLRGVTCRDYIYRRSAEKASVVIDKTGIMIKCGDNPYSVSLALRYGKRILLRANTQIVSPQNIISKQLAQMDKGLQFLAFFFSLIAGLAAQQPDVTKTIVSVKITGKDIGEAALPHPRLYGFDRMHVVENIIYGEITQRYPIYYLEEHGRNLGPYLYASDETLDTINDIIGELSGVTVKPLSDGRLAFFDGDKEVGASSISDTVLRIIYGVAALLPRSHPGIELGDRELSVSPIIMLEEPEAHMYPIAYTKLVEAIKESISRDNHVIITTHSGRLAVALWEKIGEDLKAYYVYRDIGGPTQIYRINMHELLIEWDEDVESLIEQPPYVVKDLMEKGILQEV